MSRQFEYQTPVSALKGIDLHGVVGYAGIWLWRVAGQCAEGLLFFSLDDLFHGLGVGRVQVVLLELADEPALVPRHSQLVREAGQPLITHEAHDVQLAQEPLNTLAVDFSVLHSPVTLFSEATAGKLRFCVRAKVKIVFFSVAQHLCQRIAKVRFICVDEVTGTLFYVAIDGVEAF